MNVFMFLLTFIICTLGVLYLVFREKVNIFLFPNNYVYVLMENVYEIKIWVEKTKGISKFKYKDGVYFFDIPGKKPKDKSPDEKLQEITELKQQLNNKEQEVLREKDENLQKIEDITV